MTFGLSKSGSTKVQSNQDTNDAAIVVRTDDSGSTGESFTSLIRQFKLLNARFEEAFRTNITKEDIEHNED